MDMNTARESEAGAVLDGLRNRWEARAAAHYRYFTESLHFDDPDAWDAQADHEVSRFLEALDPAWVAGATLLEIGCGPARLLQRFASRFRRVIGTDLSPTMLGHARKALGANPRVTLCLSDGGGLPFLRDATIDMVVMHAVAIHLPLSLIARYVDEAFRVLAAGGRFRCTLKRRPRPGENSAAAEAVVRAAAPAIPAAAAKLAHMLDLAGHAFEDQEIAALFRAHGFERFTVETVGLEMFAVDAVKA
jgi:ubiquinone/menaquinone biosynthesis C-methylase UbiE